MPKKISLFLLLLTVLFGAFFRTYGLDRSPPSLNWDEAAFGYNAYSISETLKDEYGVFLPIFTRSFDEYKPMIPVYLSIPFIKVFGLNEIGVRALSATSGILLILVVYLLALKIFKRFEIANLAAFFLSIEPFAIFYSRVMYEVNLAVLFYLTGILIFLHIEKRQKLLYLASALLILSMYTYNSFKLVVPLTFVTMLALNFRTIKKDRRQYGKIFAWIIFLLIPFIWLSFQGITFARTAYTSIFSIWPSPHLEKLVNKDFFSIYNLIFLNPVFFFIWEISGRYLAHFSPPNLFLREALDSTLRIPTLAVLNKYEFFFYLTGLLVVIRKWKEYKLFICLLFIAPVSASLTWNWFQSVRSVHFFVLLVIVLALGAFSLRQFLVKLVNRKLGIVINGLFYGVILLFGIWSVFYTFDSLLIIMPKDYRGDWQGGFRESIPEVMKLESQYKQVIIDSPQAQTHIFTLLYGHYPPQKYLSEVDWEKTNKTPRKYYDFGKFKFREIYWPDDRSLKGVLFLGDQYSIPESDLKTTPNVIIYKEIKDKDGNLIYRIVGLP